MCVDAYIHSCDIKITERDADGKPRLLGLTERYADAQAKIRALLNNKNIAFFGSVPDAKELFQNSQSLFLANNIETAHIMRSMKDDFGIIPYPKFDEAQERYITYNAIGDSTAFVIPVTADEELSGAVLEALAYYGWKDLLPAVLRPRAEGQGGARHRLGGDARHDLRKHRVRFHADLLLQLRRREGSLDDDEKVGQHEQGYLVPLGVDGKALRGYY